MKARLFFKNKFSIPKILPEFLNKSFCSTMHTEYLDDPMKLCEGNYAFITLQFYDLI